MPEIAADDPGSPAELAAFLQTGSGWVATDRRRPADRLPAQHCGRRLRAHRTGQRRARPRAPRDRCGADRPPRGDRPGRGARGTQPDHVPRRAVERPVLRAAGLRRRGACGLWAAARRARRARGAGRSRALRRGLRCAAPSVFPERGPSCHEREHPRRAPGPVDELQRRDNDERAGDRQRREVRELGQAVASGAEQEGVDRERRVEAARRARVDADGLDPEADDVRMLGEPLARPRRPAPASPVPRGRR